jgi:hypothetical protein
MGIRLTTHPNTARESMTIPTSILTAAVLCLASESLPEDFTLPAPPGQFARAEKASTTFRRGDPLIVTSYFYWYDAESKAHIVNGDGSDALTDHPPTLDGFSYRNVAWHAGQLEDMIAAGVDAALPVYWGDPASGRRWSDLGLPPLIAAREQLLRQGEKPPAIGMFYDTSTLRHNARGCHVDLRTAAGRLWFYGTIRNFFSLVPIPHRAHIDGKPLVFLYSPNFAQGVDEELFPAVRAMFRQQFGSDLYLVKMLGWPGQADSQYMWGGAIRPQFWETAALGPGYDHSAVPGRAPLVRDREDGQFYARAWETLLGQDPARRPWLVHLETWNEFHEGTEICQSREHGRKYIELTRRFADLFHAGRSVEARGSSGPSAVRATPDAAQGITLLPQSDGDGDMAVARVAGRNSWNTVATGRSPRGRYLYFDVDDGFLVAPDELLEVAVHYYDAGPKEFRFEYDSSDPRLSGIPQAFRLGHRQPLAGQRAWREATFVIPFARFMGRGNGADFRLGCSDADLAVSRVALRRLPRGGQSEAEALAAGRELGIGSASLIGPKSVEAYTHQTWTLVYTAGQAGIRPGGGLRVAMRHLHSWTPPQTTDPRGEGYLTVQAANDTAVEVTASGNVRRLFNQYFPWQNIVEIRLPERGLAAGQAIRITYGDRSGGGPGIRIQPFDETRFAWRFYVDALGDGQYLPLADNPAIEIVAAEPHRLSVVMPSDAVAGQPTWCLVRAEDRYGNPAHSYRGEIRWKSIDPDAQLPAEYRFAAEDRGVRRFENLRFSSLGRHTVTVADGVMERRGNPVKVTAQPGDPLLLWGDLHGHTLYSDGRGTVEEYYDFAERVVGLDFCAVTDHAFEMLDDMWAHSKQVTNRAYKPGRFVTFPAYEWSGPTNVGGDHNVYFLDNDPPLYRSTCLYDPRNFQMDHVSAAKVLHVQDLFGKLDQRLRGKNVFCIPHYGGRPGNPKWGDPGVQRLIEVFSEHRRSEDWAATFLKAGHRLGVMASTDNHFGNPGHGYLRPTGDWDRQEIGMAALAVYASERTRESIFRALYDRRVYATSGPRILLDFRADGRPMGGEYRTDAPPALAVEAAGTAPILRVEIKKNSEVVHTFTPNTNQVRLQWRDPDFRADRPSYYYVRVVQTDNEEAISSPIWVN